MAEKAEEPLDWRCSLFIVRFFLCNMPPDPALYGDLRVIIHVSLPTDEAAAAALYRRLAESRVADSNTLDSSEKFGKGDPAPQNSDL